MNMKKKFSLLTYIQNHSLQVNLQMEHVMQQALKILNIYILVPFTFIDKDLYQNTMNHQTRSK